MSREVASKDAGRGCCSSWKYTAYFFFDAFFLVLFFAAFFAPFFLPVAFLAAFFTLFFAGAAFAAMITVTRRLGQMIVLHDQGWTAA